MSEEIFSTVLAAIISVVAVILSIVQSVYFPIAFFGGNMSRKSHIQAVNLGIWGLIFRFVYLTFLSSQLEKPQLTVHTALYLMSVGGTLSVGMVAYHFKRLIPNSSD